MKHLISPKIEFIKNLLSQIYIGMVTNLDKFDDVSEIWKLVGWITPMSYDMIIYNNPMR